MQRRDTAREGECAEGRSPHRVMVPFSGMEYVALVAIALAIVWWWISRAKITTHPVALMTTRIVFPGGIHLKDHEKSITHLRNPEEIVIPFEHATLVIDYPLTAPATISLDAAIHQGFTRVELIKQIHEAYVHVYEAEEETATTKPVPPAERKTEHRNRTDGVYGIWGHDLEKLVVTAARWTRKSDGSVTIELHVES
jgi:hypothetical protein